jgi:hypothetical protein
MSSWPHFYHRHPPINRGTLLYRLHLSGTVGQLFVLQDEVQPGGDLPSDLSRGQVQARIHRHGFETSDHVDFTVAVVEQFF